MNKKKSETGRTNEREVITGSTMSKQPSLPGTPPVAWTESNQTSEYRNDVFVAKLLIRYFTDVLLALLILLGFCYCARFVKHLPRAGASPFALHTSGIVSLFLLCFGSFWTVSFGIFEAWRLHRKLSRSRLMRKEVFKG